MVGQVLADFVTAGEIAGFPPAIQAGIRCHQRIDAFADGHPVFARARRRMKPPYRRFAGVLLDVYFDHFLAIEWHVYGNGSPLAAFAAGCYEALRRYRGLQVPRYRRAVEAMRRDDWLVGYSTLEGVDRALRGIGRRFPRANPLDSGIQVLQAGYQDLQADFRELFPVLIDRFGRVPIAAGRPDNAVPRTV